MQTAPYLPMTLSESGAPANGPLLLLSPAPCRRFSVWEISLLQDVTRTGISSIYHHVRLPSARAIFPGSQSQTLTATRTAWYS